MRHTATESRACGRYAVGLRPTLDTDAERGAPKTRRRTPKERSTQPRLRLDRPPSFRNDSRQVSSAVLRDIPPTRPWATAQRVGPVPVKFRDLGAGAGSGLEIAWTAHDDEFSSRDPH
jgi:hypothetical protein